MAITANGRSLVIRTNNQRKEILSAWDLTEKELKEFDYIEDLENDGANRFVRFKGVVYDLHEFQRITRRGETMAPMGWGFVDHCDNFRKWHGIQPDSYFSGILVKYSEDFETVVMGWYYR
jgi:hypothetical protein